MYFEKLVLGFYSVTPVHAGSGAEISVIDLPIQRERHTGFPVIWGQSLKGVLRSAFRTEELRDNWKEYAGDYVRAMLSKNGKTPSEVEVKKELEKYTNEVKGSKRDPPKTEIIFGSTTSNAGDHAGAIAVGDAKILLFPVRSAKGVFAYVTSPLVLKRFKEDMELVGKKVDFTITGPEENEAFVAKNSAVKPSKDVKDNVVLEDVALNAREEDLGSIVEELKKLLPDDIGLEKRLVIVHDDVFRAFVRLSTEVVARVAIDASKGTVRQGGLWYEEFLPRDTLLYSVIAVGNPKVKGVGELETADEVKDKLGTFLNGKYLQVGGDETVGKGFVRVKVRG